jgi:hypothetical protein
LVNYNSVSAKPAKGKTMKISILPQGYEGHTAVLLRVLESGTAEGKRQAAAAMLEMARQFDETIRETREAFEARNTLKENTQ